MSATKSIITLQKVPKGIEVKAEPFAPKVTTPRTRKIVNNIKMVEHFTARQPGVDYSASPRFALSPSKGRFFSSFSKWCEQGAHGGPTSRIIRQPQDWCDEGLLIPHEAIREALFDAAEALRHLEPRASKMWKVDNFFTWYLQYHLPSIHHHHDAEEQIYLPWMATRVAIPEKLAADHVELLETMDSIRALYDTRFDKACASDAAAEALVADLRAAWAGYSMMMQDHLAEEEEVIPALLRANFTVEEEAVVVGEIIASLGLDGNKKFLPNIIDAMSRWGGEKKVEEFMLNIPPPIRFLYATFWQPDYENNQKALLRSLKAEHDPFEPTGCMGLW